MSDFRPRPQNCGCVTRPIARGLTCDNTLRRPDIEMRAAAATDRLRRITEKRHVKASRAAAVERYGGKCYIWWPIAKLSIIMTLTVPPTQMRFGMPEKATAISLFRARITQSRLVRARTAMGNLNAIVWAGQAPDRMRGAPHKRRIATTTAGCWWDTR